MLPAELAGKTNGARERAGELLDTVGSQERHDHYPVQLSGGEQQTGCAGPGIHAEPPLLLADEPTGNLDSTNGRQVLELLLTLNRSEGTTLFW